MEILIERATFTDAKAILTLQKLAYQSEARLYKNDSLPPLTESLEDLIAYSRLTYFWSRVRARKSSVPCEQRPKKGAATSGD